MLNNKNICFFIENLWKTEYKKQSYKHLLSQYRWTEKTVLLSSLNFKMKNKINEEDVANNNENIDRSKLSKTERKMLEEKEERRRLRQERRDLEEKEERKRLRREADEKAERRRIRQ